MRIAETHWAPRIAALLILIGALACPTSSVSGQTRSDVTPGTDVRVRLPWDTTWVAGRVVESTARQLRLLESNGYERSLSWTDVRELQVRAGTRSHARAGAIMGGFIFGGAGLALGLAMSSDDFFGASGGDVMALTAAGLAGGAAAGALVGTLFRSDRWVGVPLGPLAVRPITAGGTIELRLTW